MESMRFKIAVIFALLIVILLLCSCNRGQYKVVQKFKPQQTTLVGHHIYSSKRAAVKDAKKLDKQNSDYFDYYVIKIK